MKLFTQFFLASLIIVKIVLGSIFVYRVELDPPFLERDALAAQEAKEDQKEDQGVKSDKGEPSPADIEAAEEEIDLDFLIEKKAELKKKEENLERKRAELAIIQEEINKKIGLLTQLRNEIRADMATKKRVESQKLRHLIKAYSAMKPQKAASLIEKLDMQLTIELLSKMKGVVVGNILTFVNVDKAAKISAALLKDDES